MKIYKPNPVTGEMEVFESDPQENLRYHVSPRYASQYSGRKSIGEPFGPGATSLNQANVSQPSEPFGQINRPSSPSINYDDADLSPEPINVQDVAIDPVDIVMSLNDPIFTDPKMIAPDSSNDEINYIDNDLNIVQQVASPANDVQGKIGAVTDNSYEFIYPDGEMVELPMGTLPPPQTKTKPIIPDDKDNKNDIISTDYGLFQINDVYHSKEKQKEIYRKLGYDEDKISRMAKDTKKLGKSWRSNIKYAKNLSEAEGWDAWTSYNNKSYEQFLDYTDQDYIDAGVDPKYIDYINSQFNDEFTINEVDFSVTGYPIEKENIGDRKNWPNERLIEDIERIKNMNVVGGVQRWFDNLAAKMQKELDTRLEKDNNTKIAKAVMMAESSGKADSVNYNRK